MPRLITQAVIADFRSRLCDVAATLFAEVGHDGFNMRELAKRLRVSPMTAYRYFKDKDEILDALRARAFGRLAGRLENVLDLSSGSDRIAAVTRVYMDYAIEEPVSYRLMFETYPSQDFVLPERNEQERRMWAAFTEHARLLLHDGMAASEVELAGQMLWSTLHGMVAMSLSGRLHGLDADQLVAETVRVLSAAYQRQTDVPHAPEHGWLPKVSDKRPSVANHHEMASLSAD